MFLETQNWLRKGDNEHEIGNINTVVEQIITHFRIPLEAKGVSIEVIHDEIEEVVQYARRYLSIGTESNKKIWYKLHTCPDSRKWTDVLLVCELLFSLPIATSRVEQTFSTVKIVKTKCRTSLHISTLCDPLEISVEGPPLSSFSADTAVNLWWHDSNTTQRVNHQPRKEYQPRAKTVSTSDNSDDHQSDSDNSTPLNQWDQRLMNFNINFWVIPCQINTKK